jgi:hypothetical protein
MEPEDLPRVKKLLQPTSSSVQKSSRSWIGSTIVLTGTVFLLLTLNEGRSGPHQPIVDSLFHSWPVTASTAILVWLARREVFGPLLSRLLRGLSGLVATYFALVSTVAFVMSQMLWDLLKAFGIVQRDVQPAVILGVIWLWCVVLIVLFLRGLFRWFRKRYEHHGVAVGFGPLYFYFRRRRTS